MFRLLNSGLSISPLLVLVSSLLIMNLSTDSSLAQSTVNATVEAESDASRLSIDPSTGMIPTADAIAMMQARIAKHDQDFFSMTILGQLMLRDAKERDDHQSYELAESAFRRAIETNAAAAKSAQVHLIEALQAQHKFKAALAQSEIALAAIPGNLVALAAQGDAQLELGDLDSAQKAYEKVAGQVRTPGVLARLARLKELTGKSSEAIELIETARQESIKSNEREQTTAWYDFRLGMMYFGSGNLVAAEKAYQAGLKRNPDDTKCLDGLAEVFTALEKFDAAETTYRRSLELEQAPPTMSKLGDLLALMGKSNEANDCWDRADALMQQESLTTGVAHYRERALFLLAHDRELGLALELAKKDLDHRGDIYAHDTLAWALYKNGRHDEAYATSMPVQQSNVQDAALMFRAGMIAADSGHTSEGIERLSTSLKTNPHFDAALAKTARETLARLKKNRTDVSASR